MLNLIRFIVYQRWAQGRTWSGVDPESSYIFLEPDLNFWEKDGSGMNGMVYIECM